MPSSRPRTIVIGTSKEFLNLSPLSLFPSRHKEIKLREAIGDLAPLDYGQRDKEDFLHFARQFPIEQLEWIKNTKEGQSSFDQPLEFQPGHYDKHGNKVVNKGAYMGNKYRRLTWDKVCSCIHTRNDVLSSQDTIHPSDNRVLSIRELMRVMTIPTTFHWTDYDDSVTIDNADDYLKANELNIRRCIGEAVPTQIMRSVSSKVKLALDSTLQNQADFFNEIKDLDVSKDIVRVKVKDIPALIGRVHQIAGLFGNKNKVELYCVDGSTETLKDLKKVLKDWDLADFIKIISITTNEVSKYSYQLTLAEGKLTLCNSTQQLFLFD